MEIEKLEQIAKEFEHTMTIEYKYPLYFKDGPSNNVTLSSAIRLAIVNMAPSTGHYWPIESLDDAVYVWGHYRQDLSESEIEAYILAAVNESRADIKKPMFIVVK